MCFRSQAVKLTTAVIKAYYIIKNLQMYAEENVIEISSDSLPAVFLNSL